MSDLKIDKKLNFEGLENQIFLLDPSLINAYISLLPYSTFSKSKQKELISHLEVQEKNYNDSYLKLIPSLKSFVDGLVCQKTQYPQKIKDLSKFKKNSFCDVKSFVFEQYKDNWSKDLDLDVQTFNLLKNPHAYAGVENKNVFWFYDSKNNILYSQRIKDISKRREKFFTELRKSQKHYNLEENLKFYEEIAQGKKEAYLFWEKYKQYASELGSKIKKENPLYEKEREIKIGDKVLKPNISDILGLTICPLDINNAVKVENYIDVNLSCDNLYGNNLILPRIKNHKNRRDTQRPAGHHLNLYSNSSFSSIPFEVKIIQPIDLIYYLAGKHNFFKYDSNGKKENPIYQDEKLNLIAS